MPKDPLTSKSAQKQTPTAKPATATPGSQAPQSTRSSTAKPATAKTNSGELGAEKQGEQGPKKAPSGQPKKQQPRALRRNFEQLTTPDGSRFHLIQDPTVAHIHWAIAAWADGRDDPPGLPGLTLATAQASL
ncbi:MAG: hypothetical protein ACI8UD_002664, partial [Planctomycetota bacterium]